MLPYVHTADSAHPAAGWYAEFHEEREGMWRCNGAVYLGNDTPTAAAAIARFTT